MIIPDGYVRVSFQQYLASLVSTTKPDGSTIDATIELVKVVEEVLNTTRTDAVEKILHLENTGLIAFAAAPDNDPAVFIAARDEFSSEEDWKGANALLNYFDTTGEYDTRTTKMFIGVREWAEHAEPEARIICEALHISLRVLFETLTRFEAQGWITIPVSFDKKGKFSTLEVALGPEATDADRRFVRAINTALHGEPVKTFASAEYMRAVEAHYEMLALNDRLVSQVSDPKNPHHHAYSEWQMTSAMLREASTFCWFRDPEVAVQAAAATLPTSFKLGREVLPTSAGFWYFADPISVPTSDDSKPIKSLLWGWGTHEYQTEFGPIRRSGLIIEAVIEDSNMVLIPTVRFFWREGLTLEQMHTNQRAEFVEKYSDDPAALNRLRLNLNAMEYMARFFAAGALWLQQKVLTTTPATIERHFRKRMVKQHNLTKPMKELAIVQLRRRQSVSEAVPGSATAIDWKCRWTVTGHWRNQPYRTTGKIEAIWIDSYVKGPDDKPMKESPRKIFAVKR